MKDKIINYFVQNSSLLVREIDLATLQLGKERQTTKYRVIAVKVSEKTGQKCHLFCLLVQNGKNDWEVVGLNGSQENTQPLSANQNRLPQATFQASLLPDGFFATGIIGASDSTIAKVRLCWRTGYEVVTEAGNLAELKFVPHNARFLEDTIDEGVVIFLAEQRFDRPDTIEYCDDLGKVISIQSWQGGFGDQ